MVMMMIMMMKKKQQQRKKSRTWEYPVAWKSERRRVASVYAALGCQIRGWMLLQGQAARVGVRWTTGSRSQRDVEARFRSFLFQVVELGASERLAGWFFLAEPSERHTVESKAERETFPQR